MASWGSMPDSTFRAQSLMMRIALLTTMPIIITPPRSPIMDMDMRAEASVRYIPRNPSGTVNMMRNGRLHDSMIATIRR